MNKEPRTILIFIFCFDFTSCTTPGHKLLSGGKKLAFALDESAVS